jgi:hypothetical protein
MKKYQEAIQRLADNKYHSLMGGGDGRIGEAASWVSWAYGFGLSQVYRDVDACLEKTWGWKS